MIENHVLVTVSSFEKAKSEMDKAIKIGRKIIFSSNDDELNRKILEKLQINVLLLNQANRKDFSKQRNSGFNQVLAKAAKKNNVTIGINLDEIINSTKEKKAETLARLRQNINLCKKNKLKMVFMSLGNKNKRDAYDLGALGSVLGMPTSITKDF